MKETPAQRDHLNRLAIAVSDDPEATEWSVHPKYLRKFGAAAANVGYRMAIQDILATITHCSVNIGIGLEDEA